MSSISSHAIRDDLAHTFAACLRTVHHPKLPLGFDAILVVGPEHARVFREAGWSKQELKDEIHALLQLSGEEIVRGAGGMAEGIPEHLRGLTLSEVPARGTARRACRRGRGLFSAIIGGWANGEIGSQPTTREVTA